VERALRMLETQVEARGQGTVREQVREEALDEGPELATGARRLVEETAVARLALRNLLRLAREAEQKGETGEYIHLTDLYSMGCNRLMRQLRAGKAEQGRLAAYLRKMFDEALREVQEEWPIL
jgi:hypothetical protein